jgi:hypothetical protein
LYFSEHALLRKALTVIDSNTITKACYTSYAGCNWCICGHWLQSISRRWGTTIVFEDISFTTAVTAPLPSRSSTCSNFGLNKIAAKPFDLRAPNIEEAFFYVKRFHTSFLKNIWFRREKAIEMP